MTLASFTRPFIRVAAVVMLSLSAAGCANSPDAQDGAGISDPLEPVNRVVFGFNDAADTLLLRPASEVYVAVAPDPVRDAVQSFLRNLITPLIVANELLQGDLNGAQVATGRLLTNTILGVGGLFDVASVAGMPYQEEDFGQTLGVWGIGSGPYVVLPLLGPSSLRDATGLAVDTVADPIRVWAYANDAKGVLYARAGVSAIDRRSRILREVDDLKRNSLDYYATVRSLYSQQRRAQIRDNNTTEQKPDFPVFN